MHDEVNHDHDTPLLARGVCPVAHAWLFFISSQFQRRKVWIPSEDRCRKQNKKPVSGVAGLSHAGSATATDETAAVQMPKHRAPHMILRPMQGDPVSGDDA